MLHLPDGVGETAHAVSAVLVHETTAPSPELAAAPVAQAEDGSSMVQPEPEGSADSP